MINIARNFTPLPIFVFGISGGTWNVIDPLIASGRLPNLQRLRLDGCSCPLLSIRAPGDKHFRPQVAWTTVATGCDPEHHQATRFFHTSDDIKRPTLWDIYRSEGLSVGLFGWPLTWPPHETKGFVVPSHLARDSRTWPPELSSIKALDRMQQDTERERKRNIRFREGFGIALNQLGNGLRLQTLPFLAKVSLNLLPFTDPEKRSLMLRHAKIELGADIFLKLYSRFKPHFSSFHTFLVDFVSHRYWRYFEPEKFSGTPPERTEKFGSAVEKAYERTDKILGRLLGILPPNSVVAVVSEHGMQAEPFSPEVGPWRYVIQARRLLELVGLADSVVACQVSRWVAYRPRAGYTLPLDTAERLCKVIVVETGLPLFQVYKHGNDEVVVKFNIKRQVARYRDGDLENLHISFGNVEVPFLEVARRLGRQRSAMHDERGILILSGTGIRRGTHLPESHLVDFAPTILSAAGFQVPSGMDGKILDVFDKKK